MPITLDVAKRLIKKHVRSEGLFNGKYKKAMAYYLSENDIKLTGAKPTEGDQYIKDHNTGDLVVKQGINPMHRADNRISNGFYPLLVKQKAAYAFTTPPTFDVGDDKTNDRIMRVFGDRFPKICKNICTEAANSGVAWIHYWINAEGLFKYAVIPGWQVHPIYTEDLDESLDAALRIYHMVEDETGEGYDVYEYWTAYECQAFRHKDHSEEEDMLEAYNEFDIYSGDANTGEATDIRANDFGVVPFIPFFNNDARTGDLWPIKELIDVYDKVYSGYMNDLDDIQEVIMVLSGYDGEDMGEFLHKLNLYKTIKVDGNEDNKNPGLSTLSIEIPVEAREKMLTLTRKSIFEQGQGIDPDPQNFGNSSGVALGYLYSLLELKTGLMETEFRLGFAELIRAICRYDGYKDPEKIVQTWTRTSVSNDAELAQIAKQSLGVISRKTIIKNHPWVDDPQDEMDMIEDEENEALEKDDVDYVVMNDGEAAENNAI